MYLWCRKLGFHQRLLLPSMILELLLRTNCSNSVYKSKFPPAPVWSAEYNHKTVPVESDTRIYTTSRTSPYKTRIYFSCSLSWCSEKSQKPHNVGKRASIHLGPWMTTWTRSSFLLPEQHTSIPHPQSLLRKFIWVRKSFYSVSHWYLGAYWYTAATILYQYNCTHTISSKTKHNKKYYFL